MNRNQSSRMSSAITIKMFGPEFVAFGSVFSLFGSDFVLFGSDFVLQAASKVLALVSPIPSIARRPIACLRVQPAGRELFDDLGRVARAARCGGRQTVRSH